MTNQMEALRRMMQQYADMWQDRLNDPYWVPDRTHIEMITSQLQRLANALGQDLSKQN